MALWTYLLPPPELQNVAHHRPDRGRKHGVRELKRVLAFLSAISAVLR